MENFIAFLVVVLVTSASYRLGALRKSSFFFVLGSNDGTQKSWVWVSENDTDEAIKKAKTECLEKSSEQKKDWSICDMKRID